MANPEHLLYLRRGPEEWNTWRVLNPDVKPDISDADLRSIEMSGAVLTDTDLSGCYLYKKNFFNMEFNGAILHHANLADADLGRVKFDDADLTGANLVRADLREASLENADLTEAMVGWTVWGNNNLSSVRGLETVKHVNPSTIGIDTIYRSRGNIPEQFLRGCGLSDWQIEMVKLHQPNLSNEEINNILYHVHDLRAHQVIQLSPLFISYSHTDSPFVDRMEIYLNEKGIRFWRDIHHATAGRLETQIDRAIRLNPTVLLILSEHSVESDWVQHEARLARKLEIETKRDVLCPIALDDSWKTFNWPKRLREQIMEYNILDFSDWKNEDNFRRMFGRLLDGLDLFYK